MLFFLRKFRQTLYKKKFSDLHKIFVSFQSLAALFLFYHDLEGFDPGVRSFGRLSEGQSLLGEIFDCYNWPAC